MQSSKRQINVAAEVPRSVANGPGVRYVVWVQGCSFRCKGCFNEELQPFIEKNLVKVEDIAEKIISTDGIEGVTYSGGEPMMQAESLYYLSRILKDHGLSVLCYSGFTFEELKKMDSEYVRKLIECLDVLIDGPYKEEEKANLPWRGSSNQKVYFITDCYKNYEVFINENVSEVELITSNKGLTMTGILNKEFNDKFEKNLKKIFKTK